MKHFIPATAKPFGPGFGSIVAGDMSLATLTSPATGLKLIDNVSYQAVWTGTPTGTFSIEVSNDSSDGFDGTFTALSVTPPSPAGVAGSSVVDLNNLPYLWVRFKYTRTAGTGSLTVTLVAKSIGA